MSENNTNNSQEEEFNGDGNKDLTVEDMNKRVEEEKARITESHGGKDKAPIESQPRETEEKKTTSSETPNNNSSSSSSSNSSESTNDPETF